MMRCIRVCAGTGMNRQTAVIICALAGCVLGGCGSSRTKGVSDNLQQADDVKYHIAFEREVRVEFDNQRTD